MIILLWFNSESLERREIIRHRNTRNGIAGDGWGAGYL